MILVRASRRVEGFLIWLFLFRPVPLARSLRSLLGVKTMNVVRIAPRRFALDRRPAIISLELAERDS